MRCFRRMICLLLLAGFLLGTAALPVGAAQTEPTTGTTDAAEETAEAAAETEDAAARSSQSSSMSFGIADYTPPEPMDHVPLYLQTDYANTPYSDGTVATSGCTMTCIAMVASYLTGREIRPDELARRFNGYDASNIQRMEAVSTVLDLTYKTTTTWQDVEDALGEGKVVIIMLGKPSPFTKSQHTVVLTGMNEDGKIYVNDPYGPNYKKNELKDGFANGFAAETLLRGFGQAWIYEGYEPSDRSGSRYPDFELTAEDRKLIASIIWLEARGESFEGQQAIAEIVFNRMASGKFCDNIQDTILADGQFRTTKFLDDAEPGELQYKALEKALTGPNVLPMNVYYFARQAPNKNVWGRIGGHVFCYAE